MGKKTKYKFVSWDGMTDLRKVEEDLETKYKDWKVVSHSHSAYGLSVLLIKEKE